MGLYNASQITEIINTAPAVDPNMIYKAMGGEAYFGGVTESPYIAAQQYGNMWYTYENAPAMYRELYLNPYLDAWNSGPVTPSAVEMLNTEPVVDSQTNLLTGYKAKQMPATTTGAGNVKAGALAGRLPIGTLVGGVAIGAGIGLKEVAQHKEFWDDVSNAVYSDIKKDPGALVGNWLQWPETETANVIWRCLEDGGIQGYCDKRDVDSVIRNLYAFNALNSGHVDPTIDHGGLQEVNYGAVDVQVVTTAAAMSGQAISAQAITAAFSGAISHTSGQPVNAISANCTPGRVSVSLYNMPDTLYINGDGSTQNPFMVDHPQDYGITCCVVRYDTQTGDITNIDYESASSIVYTSPMLVNDFGFCSNVGAVVVPHNPAVIDNPSALQAPSDPDDFWTIFAEWLANGFTNRSYDPLTNSYVDTTYIPFTAPDINWQTDPITGDQPRVWTGQYEFVDPFTDPTTTPVNNPSPWVFESIGNFSIPDINIPTNTPWDNNPRFPNPTPTPIGSSPTIAAPSSGVSSGSKLYSVYNPSQANIDALGAYLWTQNIIDLIEKFFSNNPLDAIISLHMIYCTPTTGSNKNIYLGYLDSGVSSPVVTSQYETIACGDVNIPELYGNALDYDGTSIQIFLPFIGWRPLKTRECMGKRLRCIYKIDVYTGTCLALLSVISANTDQLLYSFEGNCSVQIPLTASDRTRMLSGLITAGVSAFTGNPAGVVGGIASMKSDVDRSGSFSGNAGAMGVKKPYVVITRPLDAQASGYNSLYGYPLNKSGVLKNFKGFTRVQSVHVDIPGATDYEKRLIDERLRNGIII